MPSKKPLPEKIPTLTETEMREIGRRAVTRAKRAKLTKRDEAEAVRGIQAASTIPAAIDAVAQVVARKMIVQPICAEVALLLHRKQRTKSLRRP